VSPLSHHLFTAGALLRQGRIAPRRRGVDRLVRAAESVRPPSHPVDGVYTEEYVVSPEEAERYATLSGKLLDGRYQVGRRLGEGGMSYVYRAQDVETGAPVAVKILLPRLSRDPAAVERLRREATIATRLTHPNVCPFCGWASPSG
jgi:hypothetical protein